MNTLKQVEIWQFNRCCYTGHSQAASWASAIASVRRRAIKKGAVLRCAESRYVTREIALPA